MARAVLNRVDSDAAYQAAQQLVNPVLGFLRHGPSIHEVPYHGHLHTCLDRPWVVGGIPDLAVVVQVSALQRLHEIEQATHFVDLRPPRLAGRNENSGADELLDGLIDLRP